MVITQEYFLQQKTFTMKKLLTILLILFAFSNQSYSQLKVTIDGNFIREDLSQFNLLFGSQNPIFYGGVVFVDENCDVLDIEVEYKFQDSIQCWVNLKNLKKGKDKEFFILSSEFLPEHRYHNIWGNKNAVYHFDDLKDKSRNKNHFLSGNCTQWKSGYIGETCIDVSSCYLSTGNMEVNYNRGFAIQCWVKMQMEGTQVNGLFSHENLWGFTRNKSYQSGFGYIFHDMSSLQYLCIPSIEGCLDWINNDDSWHHLVISVDTTSSQWLNIFLDGVDVGHLSYTPLPQITLNEGEFSIGWNSMSAQTPPYLNLGDFLIDELWYVNNPWTRERAITEFYNQKKDFHIFLIEDLSDDQNCIIMAENDFEVSYYNLQGQVIEEPKSGVLFAELKTFTDGTRETKLKFIQ